MNPRLAELVDLLDLEEIDTDVYRGQNESDREGRLFGGQVAAQALAAAGRSVENWFPHSLHGYFLRPGDPARPVLYTVDRIRDGRSFATRRVVALQGGRAIFNTAISFHGDEPGHEHQLPMPDAPAPEEVPSWPELVDRQRAKLPERVMPWVHRERSIDLRHVQIPSYLGGDPFEGPGLIWFRADGEIADDPLLHQCIITYTSDMSLIDNMVRSYVRTAPGRPLMTASLDHAIWFHRRTRADDWLLYVQDSPAAAGARGFARGTIFTREGVLVASVAQEGLMRPTTEPEDRSQ
ncbi:MAG: acyl-CoA thioesterase II [Myxococcales bacterium]|nr:acyl-CoA thioesterase II [Myxococcales bacterium]